jgi:nitrate reductase gamma subunit
MEIQQVRLLPGPTAYRYSVWGMFFFIVSGVLVPIGLVTYLATGSTADWQSPLVWIIVILCLTAALSGFLLLLMTRLKGRREVNRGYTTAVGMYQEFKQVDPRSGMVIRAAGTPFLSRRPDGFDKK